MNQVELEQRAFRENHEQIIAQYPSEIQRELRTAREKWLRSERVRWIVGP